MSLIETVATWFTEPRPYGAGFMVRCPAHDDHQQSLHLSIGRDGRILFHCHAGCKTIDILDRVGKSWKDVFPDGHGLAIRQKGPMPFYETTYDYRDENGILLYQSVRIQYPDDKTFFARTPRPDGGWENKLGSVRRVLYNLPAVIDAIKDGQPIVVVEGEKDADTLIGAGIIATSNVGGASKSGQKPKWRRDYSSSLAGAHVVLIPDNDPVGFAHMQAAYASLLGTAASVRILQLTGAAEKGDISDAVAEHGDGPIDELRTFLSGARERGRFLAELSADDLTDRAGVGFEPEQLGKPSDDAILIWAQDQNIPEVSSAAWNALQKGNTPERFFVSGGSLTRIGHDEDNATVLQPLTEDRLLHELARSADWWRIVKDPESGLPVRRHAKPPRDIAKDMIASPVYPFPTIRRLITAPTFASNGSLAINPGYHAPSSSYYSPNGLVVPAIPDRPTSADIDQARSLIVDDLFGDFPFTGAPERAHALAFLLLPFVRSAIDGPTPLHLISKPSAGTGATLLVDSIALITTGRPIAIMTEGKDEDEWRKRITATLRALPPWVLIDNLRRPLDSAALSAAITGTVWTDRILGVSDLTTIPISCGWVATGNNPGVSSEIARRIVRIHMDAQRDKPFLRDQDSFRHPNLREWINTNRGDLVAACLTLIQAWFAAGKPAPDARIRLGSFESWSRVMGGVLDIAGIPGFLGNLREFYDKADVEGNVIRAFLDRWWAEHGSHPVVIKDLIEFATDAGLALGNGTERSQLTILGSRIAKLRDQHYSLETESGDTFEIRILEAGKDSRTKATRWSLQTAELAEPSEPSERFTPRVSANAYANTSYMRDAREAGSKGSASSEGSAEPEGPGMTMTCPVCGTARPWGTSCPVCSGRRHAA